MISLNIVANVVSILMKIVRGSTILKDSSTEKKHFLPFSPPKNAFVQEEVDERRRQCDEFCKYQAEL